MSRLLIIWLLLTECLMSEQKERNEQIQIQILHAIHSGAVTCLTYPSNRLILLQLQRPSNIVSTLPVRLCLSVQLLFVSIMCTIIVYLWTNDCPPESAARAYGSRRALYGPTAKGNAVRVNDSTIGSYRGDDFYYKIYAIVFSYLFLY